MSKRRSVLKRTATSSGQDEQNTTFKPAKRRAKLTSDSCSFAVAEQLISALSNEYTRHSNKKDAEAMKKYMREQFEFFGIKAPERRTIDKQVTSRFTKLDFEGIHCLLTQCWQKDQREFQHFALDMASTYRSVLSGDKAETCMESLQLTKTLITTKSWWDTVDMLASSVVGHLASVQPDSMCPVLDEWITSDNLWLRRTAIIHQLTYKDNTNKDKLFRYCLACCQEKEFFIKKAIGWALRQYHKTNPKDVQAFVKKNANKLSKLSVKEALKHV